MTLELINTDIKSCPKSVAENKVMVFKECTDKIISSAKEIKNGLVLFEQSVITHKRTISTKIDDNKIHGKMLKRYLIITLVIITIYLFVA